MANYTYIYLFAFLRGVLLGDAGLGAVESGHYLALDAPNEMTVPSIETRNDIKGFEHDVLYGRFEDLTQEKTLADVGTTIRTYEREGGRTHETRVNAHRHKDDGGDFGGLLLVGCGGIIACSLYLHNLKTLMILTVVSREIEGQERLTAIVAVGEPCVDLLI